MWSCLTAPTERLLSAAWRQALCSRHLLPLQRRLRPPRDCTAEQVLVQATPATARHQKAWTLRAVAVAYEVLPLVLVAIAVTARSHLGVIAVAAPSASEATTGRMERTSGPILGVGNPTADLTSR